MWAMGMGMGMGVGMGMEVGVGVGMGIGKYAQACTHIYTYVCTRALTRMHALR